MQGTYLETRNGRIIGSIYVGQRPIKLPSYLITCSICATQYIHRDQCVQQSIHQDNAKNRKGIEKKKVRGKEKTPNNSDVSKYVIRRK